MWSEDVPQSHFLQGKWSVKSYKLNKSFTFARLAEQKPILHDIH